MQCVPRRAHLLKHPARPAPRCTVIRIHAQLLHAKFYIDTGRVVQAMDVDCILTRTNTMEPMRVPFSYNEWGGECYMQQIIYTPTSIPRAAIWLVLEAAKAPLIFHGPEWWDCC